MLYIVVPTFNRIEICKNFLSDLEKQSNQNYYLVLVDHGKNKIDFPVNKEHVHIIQSSVNGWARAVNVGLRYIMDVCNKENDYVLIINDDVILEDNYLQSVYDSIIQKPESVLGTCCIDKNTGKTLRVSIILNKLKGVFQYKYQYIDALDLPEGFIESDVLTGKGTVFPLRMLNNIGIYNEEKLPHYKADHELVWRAKQKGYSVFASTYMQLRTLSDQKEANGKEPFWDTMKFLYFDMRSTMRLKDCWNFARLAFSFPYAVYYFLVSFFWSTLFMLLKYFRTK